MTDQFAEVQNLLFKPPPWTFFSAFPKAGSFSKHKIRNIATGTGQLCPAQLSVWYKKLTFKKKQTYLEFIFYHCLQTEFTPKPASQMSYLYYTDLYRAPWYVIPLLSLMLCAPWYLAMLISLVIFGTGKRTEANRSGLLEREKKEQEACSSLHPPYSSAQ